MTGLAEVEDILERDLGDVVAVGPRVPREPGPGPPLAEGAPLNAPNPKTFYGGGAEGYTDYPALP